MGIRDIFTFLFSIYPLLIILIKERREEEGLYFISFTFPFPFPSSLHSLSFPHHLKEKEGERNE